MTGTARGRAWLALLRREAAILLPWIVLFASAACTSLIDDMLIDNAAPSALLGLNEGGEDRLTIWAFWFLIGALVGAHDARHGTRAFLDTLPVSRTTRFLWRAVGCGGAVVAVAVVGEAATVIQILRDAARYPDGTIGGPLGIVGLSIATTVVRTFSAVSLGLMLWPLRQVTWVLSFLLVVAGLIIADRRPELQGLLPSFIGVPFEVGAGVRIARDGLVLSLQVSALALLIGTLLTARRQRPEAASNPRLGVLALVVTLGGLGFLWKLAWDRVDEPPLEVETRRYVFALPFGAVLSTDEQATFDADLEAIEARFGHRLPPRLRADATGTLESAHGKAHGLAIALTRRAVHDRFVVAHETTHAMTSAIVGHDLDDGLDIFTEGLANHVARRLTETTLAEHMDPMARLVALAHEGRLGDHLVWNARAARDVGGDLLVYAIGEVFVDAMVDVYGDDAPARVLRALSTSARHLHGEALWHDTLARSDMLFEPIRAAFFARVLAAKDAANLPALPPRPLVAAEIDDGTLSVWGVDRHGLRMADVNCSIRNHLQEASHQHQRACRVPLSSLAGPTAEVRVSAGHTTHSLWVRVRLPPR